MTYTEYTELPEFEQMIRDANDDIVNLDATKWSSDDMAPPKIGDVVCVNFNRIGPARVIGYFVEGGWLGLKVEVLNPPEWYRTQNKDNVGHVFGAEIRPVDMTGTPNELGRAALSSYARQHGRYWKEDLRDDWFHARAHGDAYWPDRGTVLHNLRNHSEFGPRGLDRFHLGEK